MEFGDEDKADITRASLHFSFSLSLRENKLVIWQKKEERKTLQKRWLRSYKRRPRNKPRISAGKFNWLL